MTDIKFPIYTIGHGNRTINDFFNLLKKYEIDFLVDVRSNPFSKFNIGFNRSNLEHVCKEYSIVYVFMGDGLGGRPLNRSCYDSDGHVLYEKVMKTDNFIFSIGRLITAYKKNLKLACMCSELKPCDCHRSELIGRYLVNTQKIDVQHIDEEGKLISNKQAIDERNGFMDDLFGNKPLASRGKY